MARDKTTHKGGVITFRYKDGDPFAEDLNGLFEHYKTNNISDVIRRAVHDQNASLDTESTFNLDSIKSMGLVYVGTDAVDDSFSKFFEDAEQLRIVHHDMATFLRSKNRFFLAAKRLLKGKPLELIIPSDDVFEKPNTSPNRTVAIELYDNVRQQSPQATDLLRVVETRMATLDFLLMSEEDTIYSPYYLYPNIGFWFSIPAESSEPYYPHSILTGFLNDIMANVDDARRAHLVDLASAPR